MASSKFIFVICVSYDSRSTDFYFYVHTSNRTKMNKNAFIEQLAKENPVPKEGREEPRIRKGGGGTRLEQMNDFRRIVYPVQKKAKYANSSQGEPADTQEPAQNDTNIPTAYAPTEQIPTAYAPTDDNPAEKYAQEVLVKLNKQVEEKSSTTMTQEELKKTEDEMIGLLNKASEYGVTPNTLSSIITTWSSGQTHGIMQLPDGTFTAANYMGPGTDLITRLKRGDEGKTWADTISKRHDMDYAIAGYAKTDEERVRLTREADDRMLKSLSKTGGKDSLINILQGFGGIKGKKTLEDIGSMNKGSFSSFDNDETSPEDRDLVMKEREKVNAMIEEEEKLPVTRNKQAIQLSKAITEKANIPEEFKGVSDASEELIEAALTGTLTEEGTQKIVKTGVNTALSSGGLIGEGFKLANELTGFTDNAVTATKNIGEKAMDIGRDITGKNETNVTVEGVLEAVGKAALAPALVPINALKKGIGHALLTGFGIFDPQGFVDIATDIYETGVRNRKRSIF